MFAVQISVGRNIYFFFRCRAERRLYGKLQEGTDKEKVRRGTGPALAVIR
jgi:hypothetical protein